MQIPFISLAMIPGSIEHIADEFHFRIASLPSNTPLGRRFLEIANAKQTIYTCNCLTFIFIIVNTYIAIPLGYRASIATYPLQAADFSMFDMGRMIEYYVLRTSMYQPHFAFTFFISLPAIITLDIISLRMSYRKKFDNAFSCEHHSRSWWRMIDCFRRAEEVEWKRRKICFMRMISLLMFANSSRFTLFSRHSHLPLHSFSKHLYITRIG